MDAKRYNSQYGIIKNLLNYFGLFLAYSVLITMYAFLCWNYTEGYICERTGTFFLVRMAYLVLSVFMMKRIRPDCTLIFSGVHSKYFFVILTLLIFIFTLLAGFYLEEFLWNPEIQGIEFEYVWLNIILELLIYCSLILLTRHIVIASICYLVINWFIGIANYFVMQFRGEPIKMCDILAASTAITVFGNYEYRISNEIMLGTLLLWGYITILIWMGVPKIGKGYHKIQSRVAYTVVATVSVTVIWSVFLGSNFAKKHNVQVDWWAPRESYMTHGVPLSLLVSLDQLKMVKPKGYSESEALKLLSKAGVEENNTVLPNIVVIMNESFSDLSVLGDFESDEYLENWKKIDPYVQRGYVYTSVFGGGTCNSEFEFLTGASMGLTGGAEYPYITYDLSDSWSISKDLKKHGYSTVAFHPFDPDNWNRKNVYNAFAFDEFYSENDMSDIDTEYLSWVIADKSDYKKLIQLYESSEKPVFLFNVTVQNHGGYYVPLRSDIELVKIEQAYDGYSDVVNYLTLMRNSDYAFKELLDYFMTVEEPTIVCMFGDHMPNLHHGFYSSLTSNDSYMQQTGQEIYMTPYVIWSNYDTGTNNMLQDTSLNYLGAIILDLAGIHDEPYENFLLDIRKEIPVMNMFSYKDKNGKWHGYEEQNDLIQDYRRVQYYELSGG